MVPRCSWKKIFSNIPWYTWWYPWWYTWFIDGVTIWLRTDKHTDIRTYISTCQVATVTEKILILQKLQLYLITLIMISAQDTPSCHIPAALTTWLPDSRCTGGDKKCSALLLTFIISTSRAWTSLLQMYLCWTRSLNIIKSKGSLQIKVNGLKFHSFLYPSLFHLQIVCPSNHGKCIFKLFTFTIILHLLIPWLLSFSACIVAKATLESLMSVHLICLLGLFLKTS